MKLANCGRGCGLEPVKMGERLVRDEDAPFGTMQETWGCPVHDANEECGSIPRIWNAAQFVARTERINAAAVAICAWSQTGTQFETNLKDAAGLVEVMEADARVRWAEMQKGE